MLVRAKDLPSFKVGAANGDIGRIHDLQVHWLGAISWSGRVIHTDLHRDAIVHAPDYEPATTLDPDYEIRLRGWYGHPARRSDAAWWH
jgi:hypothetical protein